MKWQYQGIGDIPFLSRSAARQIRDITLRSITLCRAAIEKHGPIPGYLRNLQILGETYTRARMYLEETRRG